MSESQNIEWKESWRDDILNGYVVLQTYRAVKYI